MFGVGIFSMKSAVVYALSCAAAILLAAGSANADKMRPGYKSYNAPHGLNANASCRRPHFNICQGCNVTIRMGVLQDHGCGLNFATLGPFAGQEVTSAPRNGSYSLTNATTAVYRPAAGYVGPDHFEARLYFENDSGKRTYLNLAVNVRVLPHF
jgi:hypothetical protein